MVHAWLEVWTVILKSEGKRIRGEGEQHLLCVSLFVSLRHFAFCVFAFCVFVVGDVCARRVAGGVVGGVCVAWCAQQHLSAHY